MSMQIMYAVIDTRYKVLVAIFLTRSDAQALLSTLNTGTLEVRGFEFNWGHWIEARKELGIY